jgi:hypothetical protein
MIRTLPISGATSVLGFVPGLAEPFAATLSARRGLSQL